MWDTNDESSIPKNNKGLLDQIKEVENRPYYKKLTVKRIQEVVKNILKQRHAK